MGVTQPEDVLTGTAVASATERPRDWNEDLKWKMKGVYVTGTC